MNRTSGNLAHKVSVQTRRKNLDPVLSNEYRRRHNALPVRVENKKENEELLIAKKIRNQMAKQRAIAIISAIILIAVITASFSGILIRHSRILELNYANARLEREIILLENESKAIREELSKRTNLEEIREIAVSRLMMQDPGEKQVKRVVIPKTDVLIVHYNPESETDNSGNMDEIFNNLEGFFKRIR